MPFFIKEYLGNQLATLKGKEKILQVILSHLIAGHFLRNMETKKKCVKFNFLEERLGHRFVG